MLPTVRLPRAVLGAVVSLSLGGCGGSAPPPRDAGPDAPAWPCTNDWVPYARGGCGPAVLLCAPDGGAAPGACNGVDLTAPRRVDDGDGGTVPGFYRQPDGAVRGAWHEPGEPGGPPALDWHPPAACPDGWHPDADGACVPALRDDCEPGTGALPGGTCTATGASECPDAPYAPLPDEASGHRAVYVRADAKPAGANGEIDHPFPTLARGIAAAGAGDWVQVAAGTYDGPLYVTRDVHVRGVCAARVTVMARSAVGAFAVSSGNAALDLRGVAIRGEGIGINVTQGARVRAERVQIQDVLQTGVLAGNGSHVTLADVLIRGTRHSRYGTGVGVLGGATLEASRVHIADNTNTGLTASDAPTEVTLRDVTVRGTLAAAGATTPALPTIWIFYGAQLHAERVLLEDNVGTGISIGADATLAPADYVVIRRTAASQQAGGIGLVASDRGHAELDHAHFDGNHQAAIASLGEGSSVTVRDSVVRDTRSADGVVTAAALSTLDFATLTAERVLVAGTAGQGIAAGSGATVAVTDSVVRATRVETTRTHVAYGLYAFGAGALTATRTLVTDTFGVGVGMDEADTTVTLLDSAVSATHAVTQRGAEVGGGIYVLGGSTLVASGVALADNAPVGVAGGATDTGRPTVVMKDSVVRDSLSSPSGYFGEGVAFRAAVHLEATRVVVANAHEGGLVFYGDGAELVARDVLVLRVAPSVRGFGAGIAGFGGGSVAGTRVAVVAASGLGLGSLPYELDGTRTEGTRFALEDTWIADVQPSTVRFGGAGMRDPAGATVAYGLHVATGCAMSGARTVVDNGGYGLFVTDAELTLRGGLITRQRVAGAANAPRVFDVTAARVSNDDDAIVRDVELPPAATLPPPEAPCPPNGC